MLAVKDAQQEDDQIYSLLNNETVKHKSKRELKFEKKLHLPIQTQIDTALLKHKLEDRLDIKSKLSSVQMRNFLHWIHLQLEQDCDKRSH